MHQSIPSVHLPSPGNRGAFPNVARPEGGAFAYLGLTPGHLTRGFVMEAFIGQDVDYVAD